MFLTPTVCITCCFAYVFVCYRLIYCFTLHTTYFVCDTTSLQSPLPPDIHTKQSSLSQNCVLNGFDLRRKFFTDVLPPGMRYRDSQVVIDTACVDEDLRMEDDERLFRLWKTIGDSIHPSIEVEVDFPSRYVEKSVPILDLRVWVEKMVDSDRFVVMHEFYMKNVSSKSVISARLALPWSVKRTVLTQEVLRILLNCSKDLPWERVAEFASDFMLRMQFSGYSSSFRYQVLNSAFAAYDRVLSRDADGTRPMYRPKEWNREERLKLKKGKKVNWYKQGGF